MTDVTFGAYDHWLLTRTGPTGTTTLIPIFIVIVNDILLIVSIFRLQLGHVASTSIQFCANEGIPLKSYGSNVLLYLFLPVTQGVSVPFFTKLDLQLIFCRPLCYKSIAHCLLLQCLRTRSLIIAGPHSYFVISSFKWRGGLLPWLNSQFSLITFWYRKSWYWYADMLEN